MGWKGACYFTGIFSVGGGGLQWPLKTYVLLCPPAMSQISVSHLTMGLYVTSLMSGLPLYTIGIIVFIWWGCCEYSIRLS